VLSADRLDYTKALPERLRTYETLLETCPQHRCTTALVQLTWPSRPSVPGYIELRMEQQDAVERINDRFAAPGWLPVLDLYVRLPQRSLTSLYRLARAALATPLRDGVNLSAKEYVAAQDPRDPGVLVLSRVAGAAELLTEALLVDPTDPAGTALALAAALAMPLDERQDRWRRMIVKLLHHDSLEWHRAYVCALTRAHKMRTGGALGRTPMPLARPRGAARRASWVPSRRRLSVPALSNLPGHPGLANPG
jgi:trehalose 6-phosphate synthase